VGATMGAAAGSLTPNDGYHDCRNIFEQRYRQVFLELLGEAPAGGRTNRRAGNCTECGVE
jgi:hypothetical protein